MSEIMIDTKSVKTILKKMDSILVDAPRLYVSHELSKIPDISEKAFKVLVASVISLRTKEKTTWAVSEKLFKVIHNWQQIYDCQSAELEALLYPCGFYIRKSKQLKEIATIIVFEWKGVVSDDIDKLVTLPGVGRKVANLVVTEVFNKPGICVDIHVHRIANRWGWVNTKLADQTEMALRKLLPEDIWIGLNQRLVMFGQTICQPVKPKCGQCFLKDKCPSASLL